MVFFNNGHNIRKEPVVFRNVHAVGETEGMYRTVNHNVNRSLVEGITLRDPFIFRQLLEGGLKELPFYFHSERLGFAESVVVIPRRRHEKSLIADISGELFRIFYLVLVMFKDDKFPVGRPPAEIKAFMFFRILWSWVPLRWRRWVSSRPWRAKMRLPL